MCCESQFWSSWTEYSHRIRRKTILYFRAHIWMVNVYINLLQFRARNWSNNLRCEIIFSVPSWGDIFIPNWIWQMALHRQCENWIPNSHWLLCIAFNLEVEIFALSESIYHLTKNQKNSIKSSVGLTAECNGAANGSRCNDGGDECGSKSTNKLMNCNYRELNDLSKGNTFSINKYFIFRCAPQSKNRQATTEKNTESKLFSAMCYFDVVVVIVL